MLVRRLLAALALGAVCLAGCGGGASSLDNRPVPQIDGVVTERAASRSHRQGEIPYAGKLPPSGGDHNPRPLTCGVYDQQPPDEFAVHSLEHGAVWIAYGPAVPAADVQVLRGYGSLDHVLVTPYAGMDTPITLVAWERRLEVQSASDPRVKEFVDGFRNGPTAPERGGACAGVGQPAS